MSILGVFQTVVRTSLSPANAQQVVETQEFGILDRLLEAVLSPPLYKLRIDYDAGQIVLVTRASKKGAIFLACLGVFSLLIAASPVAASLIVGQFSTENLEFMMIVALTLIVGLISLRVLGRSKHDRFVRLIMKALSEAEQFS